MHLLMVLTLTPPSDSSTLSFPYSLFSYNFFFSLTSTLVSSPFSTFVDQPGSVDPGQPLVNTIRNDSALIGGKVAVSNSARIIIIKLWRDYKLNFNRIFANSVCVASLSVYLARLTYCCSTTVLNEKVFHACVYVKLSITNLMTCQRSH